MEWRQFLFDEIDRKIDLIRLVIPKNVPILATADDKSESDIPACVIQ
jgi:hypothetical protein